MKTLVTGGAGFIGSHVVKRLLEQGDEVRVLDRLDPQTHGDVSGDPPHPPALPPEAELVVGDVRDAEAIRASLQGVDRVVHLAAAVGVGQSMYQSERYVSENSLGTAAFMSAAVEAGVRRVVVASSMSIYGEGMYVDADGQQVPVRVQRESIGPGTWDPMDAQGRPLRPVPTPEHKCPDLASVYALTKYDQERLCLMLGQAYGVPTLALRFFNTYGPGQALQNPYTGVLAIFGARLLNDQPPLVFEDGRQQRDFVHVDDVSRACVMALGSSASGEALNIGTGQPQSVLDVASGLARSLGRDIAPQVTQKARAGDIRHCFADTRRAEQVIGFRAEVAFDEGVDRLAQWLQGQRPQDLVPAATRELEARGLIR